MVRVGVHAHPFQPITITYKVAVYALAERADTLTLFPVSPSILLVLYYRSACTQISLVTKKLIKEGGCRSTKVSVSRALRYKYRGTAIDRQTNEKERQTESWMNERKEKRENKEMDKSERVLYSTWQYTVPVQYCIQGCE